MLPKFKKYKTKAQKEFEEIHNKMLDDAYKNPDEASSDIEINDLGIDYFERLKNIKKKGES